MEIHLTPHICIVSQDFCLYYIESYGIVKAYQYIKIEHEINI